MPVAYASARRDADFRVTGFQQASVFGSELERPNRTAVRAIDQRRVDLFGLEEMRVRPLAQRDQHREEVATLAGERVLLIGASVRRRHHFEDALRNERPQPCCKDVLRDAEALLELAESALPCQRVTDDQ